MMYSGARRVVFSANGLREGWYARQLGPEERRRDPLAGGLFDVFNQDVGHRLDQAAAELGTEVFSLHQRLSAPDEEYKALTIDPARYVMRATWIFCLGGGWRLRWKKSSRWRRAASSSTKSAPSCGLPTWRPACSALPPAAGSATTASC